MTGHGQATVEDKRLTASVEIRTVNNRFLKVAMNSDLPVAIQSFAEDAIRKSLIRGTVNVRIRLLRHWDASSYQVNAVALAAYRQQIEQIQWNGEPASLDTLLNLPGVIVETSSPEDSEEIWPVIQTALDEALSHLNAMRAQEGEAMQRNLEENLQLLIQCVASIEAKAPQIVEFFGARLTDRINALLERFDINIQPGDLIREIGIFSERADVAEETVRLKSHLNLFQETMRGPESNGRKLDFVVQEMLRETNTIGSKCGDALVAGHVVEMKTTIERMREMVQNIE
jgi:uncharacterized protein (TIGR00255 family)